MFSLERRRWGKHFTGNAVRYVVLSDKTHIWILISFVLKRQKERRGRGLRVTANLEFVVVFCYCLDFVNDEITRYVLTFYIEDSNCYKKRFCNKSIKNRHVIMIRLTKHVLTFCFYKNKNTVYNQPTFLAHQIRHSQTRFPLEIINIIPHLNQSTTTPHIVSIAAYYEG